MKMFPKLESEAGVRMGAQTAGRALDFLRFFVAQDSPVTLGEMAAASKLNKTTAYRVLCELEGRAFIGREPNGKRYVVGPELIALSTRVLKKINLRAVARPVIERLVALTKETVILNMRFGDSRLTIEGIESPQSVRRVVPLGELVPLYATPSGRMMLAFLADDEVSRMLVKAKNENYAVQEIRQSFIETRKQGYLISAGTRYRGHSILALPVFSHVGIVAAISVSGPKERWNLKTIKQQLAEIKWQCGALTHQLGGAVPNMSSHAKSSK